MGVKRSEMRLLTAYVEARIEVVGLRLEALNNKRPLQTCSQDDYEETALGARKAELTKLFDILGGYND